MAETDYVSFCRSSSPFYERARATIPGPTLQRLELPDDWQSFQNPPWELWQPAEARFAVQGWKIHISATPENASQILERISRICIQQRVLFKFLRSRVEFLLANAKHADRSSSGKFITVYPSSNPEMDSLAREFGATLASEDGPYILSDIRVADGPVYARYGAFIPLQFFDNLDEKVLAVQDSAGLLSADARAPYFSWSREEKVPEVVKNALELRAEECSTELDRYESIEPLHFSNSGGVYRARETGQAGWTILKEARPHAGYDFRERDSVSRLKTEEAMLKRLADTGLVPRPIRSFQAWEHQYLEMEYIDASSLREWTVKNYPYKRLEHPEYVVAYTKRAKRIASDLLKAIEEIHTFGHVIGDIHPDNILISEDGQCHGRVIFIDLEDGRTLEEATPAGFNAIGYQAPDEYTPREADWYSAARTIASMFAIDFPIETLCREYWPGILDRVRNEFDADSCRLIQLAESHILPRTKETVQLRPAENVARFNSLEPGEVSLDDHSEWIERVCRGITETRFYRRWIPYPGGIEYSQGAGTINVASGLSGVAMMLSRAQEFSPFVYHNRESDCELLSRAVMLEKDHIEPGLFSGALGIAAALYELGEADLARDLSTDAAETSKGLKRTDLYGGLAGVAAGLAGMAFALQTQELLDRLNELDQVLQSRLFSGNCDWAVEPLNRRGGLLYGWSGVALAEIALATISDCPRRNHDLAYRAISNDLAHTHEGNLGMLGVDDKEGGRSLPYLAWGSGGVLFVIDLLRRLPGYEAAFDQYLSGLMAACTSDTYAFSGLFNGRAGTLTALATRDDDCDNAISHQMSLLFEYALSWRNNLVFPGDGYLRLSSDLATGSAGICAALIAASDDPLSWLPIVKRHLVFPNLGRRNNSENGGES